MPIVTINLSDSIHIAVRELAEKDGVTVDQFIAWAVSEKVSAMQLRERAAKGNLADFDRILALVPDRAPDPGDQLP